MAKEPGLDVQALGGGTLVRGRDVDAVRTRERSRRRRLRRIVLLLLPVAAFFWFRALTDDPVGWGLPSMPEGRNDLYVSIGLMLVLVLVLAVPMLGAGRSPHVVLRPYDTGVRLADVVGADATVREAVDTLNLFLSHDTFRREMGGSPRRGVLFEGPPGTGKTYLAKAMAGEAGVPFLFVSASAFQSMYYGQTNRKIRSFFKALRKHARSEGGAIGFIEEFDAIGGARSGMGASTQREGISGVVNELLVQMQSFDLPTGGARFVAFFVDGLNLLLPSAHQLRRPSSRPANVLIVAATNRAADLDPALLRPGRFDRVIHFGLPARRDRAAIAAYYLARKAHDEGVTADGVAEVTSGYSPVRIERLFDEALICALRAGRTRMTWADVMEAKLITELGLSHRGEYDPLERQRIAVHEASHALVADLVGRKVTVASILRRSDALGMVAHSPTSERYVVTPSEAKALMQIALAGLVGEEVTYGEASSGVAGDLQAATTMAAMLVGSFGQGGSRLSLEAGAFGSAGNLVAKVLADTPSREAAERLVDEAEATARRLVEAHPSALAAIAEALMQRDELSGDEVRALVAAHRDTPTPAEPA